MSEVVEQKVIVWDLLGTLGEFRAIFDEVEGKPLDDFRKPVGKRKGIIGVLEALSREGFSHRVITSAKVASAREALRRGGFLTSILEDHIIGEDTKGQEQFNLGGMTKPYGLVIKRMGWSHEEAIKKMIVVGDSTSDQPRAEKDLTFMRQQFGECYPALGIKRVINYLYGLGNEDFQRGFKCLYASVQRDKQPHKLGDGTELWPNHRDQDGNLVKGDISRAFTPWISVYDPIELKTELDPI